ncbi:MAG: response regulator [Treponema sp.]|nr:response regulator [Treponema sp.]
MDDFKTINEAVEALNRSKKMAEALNKTAAVFLSSNADTFENMMSTGMGIIANAADLDRLNLWRNYSTKEGLFASQIYRWDRAAGGTTEPTPELKSVSYSVIAPQWEKIFKNNNSVNSPVKDITGNEGIMMNAYGAKSVFVTPIFIKGGFWGFLLYSDHHNERHFDDCCTEMMKSAAFLCANAVIRAEMEKEINSIHNINETVLKSAPFGLVFFNEELNIIDCNDEVLKIFGDTKENCKKDFFAYSPEYQEDGKKSFDKANEIIALAKNGEASTVEWLHKNKNGELIPCELTMSCIRQNNIFMGIAFLYDLRNIRKMENEILKAYRFNRAIIDSMPIGMAIISSNPPSVIDCNEELTRMFKAPKHEIVKNYFKHFAPMYLKDGRLANHDALDIMTIAMNGETVRTERYHQTSDGTPMPCDLTLTRVKDEEDFIGLGFLYDLTEVKKREAEITQAKEINELQLTKLDLVIKSTKIGLWDMEINKDDPVNPDNTVIFSDDIRHMLGYSDEEDYPNKIRTWGEGLHPEDRDRAVEALTNHLFDKTGNTPYYLEFRLKRKDGEYIYIQASGETIRDNEGNAVRTAGALKDITEEKNILLNTEKLRAEAEAASMAKSNFLSNMSHEIRTPMNAIIGMTVIGKSAEDTQRKDYCLEKIENASQHLLGVINDILDMSKIEANKFELSEEEFDFEKMLQRVVNIIAFRADEKRQRLSVHIDKSIPRFLLGDDQRLAQVITNLLGNAVKFTPEEGSIKLDTRFLGKEGDFYKIQITVTDSGIGISEEQQEQLFQSFQQADSKTSRKFGGTGLGLVISKNIVELMGGQIGLTSELGNGSSFSITFCVKRGTKKASGLSEIGVNWGNISIMAVDDDQEILNYFKEILQGFGSDCDTALSGQEALALIGMNGMYDIYFVDWKMPDMDGIKLAKELKARSKSPEHTIVIMISAAEWSSIADKAKKAGVDKFLSKPLFPSAIADVITEAIGSHKLPSEASKENNENFKGFKILLAEDVDINREIVETLLEPTFMEVDCAENGKEAVAKFEKFPDSYDLILMDVQMPEMDGLEATRRIRAIEKKLIEKNSNYRKLRGIKSMEFAKQTPKQLSGNPQGIPIIAMTANVFKEDVEKCLNAGMNNHIGKPLDINEFFRALRKYLKRTH